MNKVEAAEFLGVSERTLANYAASGRLPFTYVKGKTRSVADYALDDLETLKAELENPALLGNSATKQNSAKPATVQNDATEQNNANVQNSATMRNGATLQNEANNATLQTLAKPASFGAEQGNIDGVEILSEAFKRASEFWPTNLAAKSLLTIPEAMILSGLKEKPLRDAIKSGALKSIRLGRSIQVRPADLNSWVDSQFGD